MDHQDLYTEKALFQRIHEGDEGAFAEFYQLIKTDCSAYAHRVLASREAAQEALQESLIRLWLHRDKLADVEHPRAWFFRLVANECTRYLEKYGFKNNGPSHLYPNMADVSQTEHLLSYRETQRIIAAVVASLPPQRRTIYQLSREEGLTQAAIADRLGVSRDYVKKALMIALQVIRQKLIDEGIFIPFILIWLY